MRPFFQPFIPFPASAPLDTSPAVSSGPSALPGSSTALRSISIAVDPSIPKSGFTVLNGGHVLSDPGISSYPAIFTSLRPVSLLSISRPGYSPKARKAPKASRSLAQTTAILRPSRNLPLSGPLSPKVSPSMASTAEYPAWASHESASITVLSIPSSVHAASHAARRVYASRHCRGPAR